MHKAFEIQKLVSSWTKFDIVKLIDITIDGELNSYISGDKEINTAVLKNFLGIENLSDPIPSIWKNIKKDPSLGKLFSCLAAFFTHHQIIDEFSTKFSSENMGGVFEMPSSQKLYTNIRRALINSGAADPEYINSSKIPYSFEDLYLSGDYGGYFKKLIEIRLSQIGWDDEVVRNQLLELSFDYKLPEFLSLSNEQFTNWLNGNSIVKDPKLNVVRRPAVMLEGLIEHEKISRAYINSKENDFDSFPILKKERDQYENKGYEIVSGTTNTLKVRKSKPHDVHFEDKVWALLARMGFDYYNEGRNFRIKFAKDASVPGKQIDVFAGDKETVLLIECKSSVTKSTGSFQKDIDQIAKNRAAIDNVIRKFFNSTPKIGYIFCTNNVLINDHDKSRMAENGIMHFNQDDLEYFNNLTGLLGRAAKYQFIGKIFEGKEIPELPNKIPAVQGKMGGYIYYSFSIEPETLLKIGFVLHRRDASGEAFESYQRMVQKNRINSIQRYIDDDNGYFPNSIIININTKRKLSFDPATNNPKDSLSRIGILHLPKYYQSAFIIDGQHRLYGYGKSVWRSRNTVPVVAFENLPAKEQTKLFVDINHEQKSVKKNLLLSIIADFNWGSDNDDEALEALRIKLVKRLNEREDSPLYKRIITAEEPKTATRCLTLEYINSYGLKRNNFFGLIKKKKLIKSGYLTQPTHKETLEKAYAFFVLCFDLMETKLMEQWQLGNEEGGFIAMNIGITSTLRIINDLLQHLEEKQKIIIQQKSAQELFNLIEDDLITICEFLINDQEKVRNFRKQFGSQGTDKVIRELQNAVHLANPNFCPDGLEDWIKTSSGQFNTPAKQIGDQIQLRIREFIFRVLKKQYGEKDKNWWIEGVPVSIQQSCGKRHIDEKRKEPEENYLDTIDYYEIIKQNKSLFGKLFTPQGEDQIKDADKKWFVKFNNIRKKYSHPERDSVTEEELDFVVGSKEWLISRIESFSY